MALTDRQEKEIVGLVMRMPVRVRLSELQRCLHQAEYRLAHAILNAWKKESEQQEDQVK